MSAIRTLSVYVGTKRIGLLFGLDDGRTYFRFDKTYILDLDRPIISLSYLGFDDAETQATLLDPYLALNFGQHFQLPTFFRNLLPEGALRKQLISDAHLSTTDELGLLAYCGTDLPGNITAIHEDQTQEQLAHILTQGNDAYEMSSVELPLPEAVSLSGVQPKVSLIDSDDGRYVMRSKLDEDEHFIGKLPASSYPHLPEIEFLSMQLAKVVRVNTCETQLLPMTAIADSLPFSLRDDGRYFLLVKRFDRDANTYNRRLHMEDFAQILALPPEQKYGATYEEIGRILILASGDASGDIDELMRRITVNVLLGNVDAHAKNFSVLYDEDQLQCRLSPAYDIVAYSAYITSKGQGLKYLREQTTICDLTPMIVRQLANAWEIPENRLKKVVTEVITLALATWPKLIRQSNIARQQKKRLLLHLKSVSFVKSYRKKRRKLNSQLNG